MHRQITVTLPQENGGCNENAKVEQASLPVPGKGENPNRIKRIDELEEGRGFRSHLRFRGLHSLH